MDGLSAGAILKAVSEYGVLGLGWVAWILTMGYLQVERKRYQQLTVSIIEHFTKVNLRDDDDEDSQIDKPRHQGTFVKLFGKD